MGNNLSGLTTKAAGALPSSARTPALGVLLHCPIRGPLNVLSLAKDGLTATEEARRIDFLKFLLDRGYPETHIEVETTVLKNIGESGRNKLRCDVLVYRVDASQCHDLPIAERLQRAVIIAEIKRDSKKSESAWEHQLEPAMRILPDMKVMGVYWDDVNRWLFVKQLNGSELEIFRDTLSSLPRFGTTYKKRLLTYDDLEPSPNLVGVLFNIANVMRSHGVNDEHIRYKETVKLLLARFCDEREAASLRGKPLALQVHPGADEQFLDRVMSSYRTAEKRYSKAKTLFDGKRITDLKERTLRDIIKQIQGIDFLAATNDTMQQVFMSFVPAVFKKSLDQYFTPIELVKVMVGMVGIGPNDKIADPGMGTADFLTAALEHRLGEGDADILQRIYGMDSDQKAFDLAVVNMILHKDGQSNLSAEDSIENHDRLAGEMGVVLCNPPFGEKSVEKRQEILRAYDLGHVWEQDAQGKWIKSNQLLPQQQLGLLFLERCYKLLDDRGRLAIILPEGYLCTPSYGHVRQWLVDHFRVLAVVELPRRTFVKSNADLRSNILVAQRIGSVALKKAVSSNYPIFADMARKIGFKMGKGYSPLFVRDLESGIEIRDEQNERITDTDFRRIASGFKNFSRTARWEKSSIRHIDNDEWSGARIDDVLLHPNLDLKPRRLMPKALNNRRSLLLQNHRLLSDIADVLDDTTDIIDLFGKSKLWRPISGQDIRAVEAVVTPSHPVRGWQIEEQKDRKVYRLRKNDIVVGLVRPERRNVGLLIDDADDIVGMPDGIAVVRLKEECSDEFSQEWLFATLRSEPCRLQLWTESGGTSYGKLTLDHIRNVLLPISDSASIRSVTDEVKNWASSVQSSVQRWSNIGADEDRKPIINSSGFGLIEATDAEEEFSEDE